MQEAGLNPAKSAEGVALACAVVSTFPFDLPWVSLDAAVQPYHLCHDGNGPRDARLS